MSETTTLVNNTRASLWLPERTRGDERFGRRTELPATDKDEHGKVHTGRLDGVPTWYVEELAKERGWARRFESGEVTVGGRQPGRPRSRADVRAENLEEQLRTAADRTRAAEARAARADHAEDEARALREKAHADQKRIAELEAELAAAKKAAAKKAEKAESDKG